MVSLTGLKFVCFLIGREAGLFVLFFCIFTVSWLLCLLFYGFFERTCAPFVWFKVPVRSVWVRVGVVDFIYYL